MNTTIKYSICVCNYNMADTLELSLSSILGQLDENYEVVVVDDGSSDGSVEVIRSLQEKYSAVRLIELKRDRNRRLGLTRNISIKEAVGEYVLLQLDCDDVYGPYIRDFVNVFHQIEGRLKGDFYLKGQKINMGRRAFMLGHGPYRNLYRGEDWEMWARLAADDTFVPLDHEPFHIRLPKTTREKFRRAIYNTWDHMRTDFRGGRNVFTFIGNSLHRSSNFSVKFIFLRLLLMAPAWVAAKLAGPLPKPPVIGDNETFSAYRNRNRGTFPELMRRNAGAPNFSNFSPKARKIFGENQRFDANLNKTQATQNEPD